MLEKIYNKLRQEPVRVRVYTVTALVVGYLLARHIVSPTDSEFILGVLGVVLGVENVRAKVTPYHADEHAVEQDFGYDDPTDEVGEGEDEAL